MSWEYSLNELGRALGLDAPHMPGVVSGVCTDSRKLAPGQVFFALSGPNFDGNDFVENALASGAAAAVCTRAGDRGPRLLVKDPLAALQQFARFHRVKFSIPVFAVTGSCGKTTTKNLCAALLRTRFEVTVTPGNLNNEIGCPLSVLELEEGSGFAVIELGANHVGEIEALCTIAQPTESAVTMVAPAHLEGFGNLERVALAKGEIARSLPADGVFYVNVDDPHCVRIAEKLSVEKVRVGTSGDVVLRSCGFDESGEMVLDIDPVGRLRLPLPVRAHATNVLFAVAVAVRHGVTEFEGPLRAACRAAARFRVLEVGGLTVLDDSYNANPASMVAALQALAERPGNGVRMAALGDMFELGEAAPALHREVGEAAGALGIEALFVCGNHAHDIIAGARDAGVPFTEHFQDASTLAEAVCARAHPGDALLVKGSRGMQMERVIEALRSLNAGSIIKGD